MAFFVVGFLCGWFSLWLVSVYLLMPGGGGRGVDALQGYLYKGHVYKLLLSCATLHDSNATSPLQHTVLIHCT